MQQLDLQKYANQIVTTHARPGHAALIHSIQKDSRKKSFCENRFSILVQIMSRLLCVNNVIINDRNYNL